MIRVSALPRPLGRRSVDVARVLIGWASLARQRRALNHLEADQLRDIGVTREEAEREALRPFWDAPQGWRQ